MKEHIHEDLGTTAGAMRPILSQANMEATVAAPGGTLTQGAGSETLTPDPSSGTLTQEEWSHVLADYHAGATAPALAARHGVTASAIYLRARGDGKRARKRAATVIDETSIANSNTDLVSRARDALRACASRDTLVNALLAIGQGLQHLATTAMKIAGAAQARFTREGLPLKRRKFSDEIWQAARHDYEEGDFTAGEIAERYGMIRKTVETRAARGGWSKTFTQAPPPLLPPDDPAQVDENGQSKWSTQAHSAQLPPPGQWSTWLFQGGRGAGKTRAGAEWLAARAEATPNGIFAIVAATEHDLREVMIEGPAGLRSLPGHEHPKYESSRRKLRWKNGAIAYGFSAEQPERLRGPQFMAAWADEFCTWKKPHAVLSNLRLGLRLGSDPRLLITTTPKPLQALRKLRDEVSCVMTQAATSANAANLAATFIDGLQALYGGTRLAEQELNGVLVDGEGALFKAEDFAATRCAPSGITGKTFDQVVVAIDPPAGLEGSACGIIVAARTREVVVREGEASVMAQASGKAKAREKAGTKADKKGSKGSCRVGYVLADRSCVGAKPLEWARIAAHAAREFGATKIVAEANQGGEMVRQTLLSAGVNCPIELVHASKGKVVRAEPVSVLYQLGRVRHCGHFRELEEELMAMGVESGEGQSNDRADALVWAISALGLITNVAGAPNIRRL